MMHRIAILIVTLLISFTSYGQTKEVKWDVGGWIGGANYFGDLNTTYSFTNIRPGFGLTARYNVNYYLSMRPFINFGMLSGSDVGSNKPFESARRLDFNTNIFEVGGQIEFNFFKFYPSDDEYYFAPYTFAGFSVFYFSPKGQLEGNPDQNLDVYSTEGQELAAYPEREKYKLIQPAIPFGIGLKYGINYYWSFAFEISHRKTYTDYRTM